MAPDMPSIMTHDSAISEVKLHESTTSSHNITDRGIHHCQFYLSKANAMKDQMLMKNEI